MSRGPSTRREVWRLSQFDGMSRAEMDGMPFLIEADMAKLGVGRERVPGIARAQLEYIHDVLDACPRRRWRKRRKLEGAAMKACLVYEMVSEARR